jgi:hypothetical protein
VTCESCGSDKGTSNGRCASCGTAPPPPAKTPPAVRCPKCRTAVEKGEKFCASCGAKIPTRADRVRALHRKRERQETDQQINRGRRWMLIVAVLTLFGGVFTYFSGTSDVEKQIKAADAAFEGMTSAERDAQVKATVGMTWQEAIDHDRGMVTFQTVVLGALGVAFIGLWWWAQTNPFAAALIALLLYITSLLVGALVDPTSLLKGFIVKGIVAVALFSAVSAGYRQRGIRRRA